MTRQLRDALAAGFALLVALTATGVLLTVLADHAGFADDDDGSDDDDGGGDDSGD